MNYINNNNKHTLICQQVDNDTLQCITINHVLEDKYYQKLLTQNVYKVLQVEGSIDSILVVKKINR